MNKNLHFKRFLIMHTQLNPTTPNEDNDKEDE